MANNFRVKNTDLAKKVGEIDASLAEKANLKTVNFKSCYLAKTLEKLYKETEDVLFMFIGDSVTCGSNATDQNLLGYVGLFAKWIANEFKDSTVILSRGKNIESLKPLKEFNETIIQTGNKNTIRIVNAGIWGDSMFQLFNRSSNFISYKSIKPDCIFLMDGINDSDPGNLNRYSDPSTFKELQSTFIDYLYDETGAEIVVQTSHWTGENPNSRINPYVIAQREVAKEKDLLLIDHKFIWDNHFNFATANYGQSSWMNDGDVIHPSDIGHQNIFFNIVNNIFKTKKDTEMLRSIKKINDINITFNGSWVDNTITDINGNASYNYKRCSVSGGHFTVPLAGNELYVILRDGRDEVTFNNNSPNYENTQIKIGGMKYPSELVTVSNEDMYAKHHKRVLLYKGEYKYCETTIQHVSGNLDIYGFETVTYKGEGVTIDNSESLTLYTDNINGSDTNTGKSVSSPFKTISKAIEFSRKYLDRPITINIMENTTEDINLTNVYPLSFENYIIKGYNNVVKNVGHIYAQKVGKVRIDYLKTITNSDYSILLNDVDFIRLNNVDISDNTNSTKIGLYLSNGSRCYAPTLNGDNKSKLIHCENGSHLTIGLTNNPTNSTILANATTGGIISFTNANIPQYKEKLSKSSGGLLINNDGTIL